jgi:hypothetical protein
MRIHTYHIILYYAAFSLQRIFNVLVGSLLKDLREDLGSWTHINSTLTRKLVWPTLITSTLIFHPLIGLFSVVANIYPLFN